MAVHTIAYYDQQYDYFWDTTNNLTFMAGIGSGKSTVMVDKCGCASLGQIGELHVPVPNTGAITAPTYTMLKKSTLPTFLRRFKPYIKSFHKSDLIATMKNGSEIYFMNASNPDALRGPNLLWWGGDEAALYSPSVWEVMSGRTREHGMYGWCWLATSPQGRNWIYKEFVEIQRPDYRLINAPTWANPYVSMQWIEKLLASYDEDAIRRELRGEMLSSEGLVYSEFRRDKHLSRRERQRYGLTCAGIDFGFNNPSVIEVVGQDNDGYKHLVYEDYRRGRTTEELVADAVQARDVYSVDVFFCDPSDPDAIRLLNAAGLNAVPADNRVQHGINVVKQNFKLRPYGDRGDQFRPLLTIDPEAVYLIAELEQYEWMRNRDGLRDMPKKSGDHAADSLRYCLVGFETMAGSGTISVEASRFA